MLTFYRPDGDGWMPFPWDPSVRVHTASVRDGARAACKLFLDPSSLPPGGMIDVTTDFRSPDEMAAEVCPRPRVERSERTRAPGSF